MSFSVIILIAVLTVLEFLTMAHVTGFSTILVSDESGVPGFGLGRRALVSLFVDFIPDLSGNDIDFFTNTGTVWHCHRR